MDPPIINISASDLDEETKTKLKGDTIGDTLYSESFVLKTLMNLSNNQFQDDPEQDLCFLWDMTVEKDVCLYLLHLKFPSIVCNVLPACEDGRVIEILIGILANVLLANRDKNIGETELTIVLNEFETSDSAVLVQLMRFLEALAHGAPQMVDFLDQNRIIFILNYSENCELISQTMRALVTLTKGFQLSKEKLSSELVLATIEGFKTLFPSLGDMELDSEETVKIVKTFLILISNYCAYAQNFHLEDVNASVSDSEALKNLIADVLRHFCEESNLLPVTDDFRDCISSFNTIVTTKDVCIVTNNFFKDTFPSICKMLHTLYREKHECAESFNMVLELVGSLFHLIDRQIILEEFKNVEYKQGVVVLNCLRGSCKTFEFDICEKLKFLFANCK